MSAQSMKFATKVIHAGIHPDPTTGAIMTPIYQTSTYVQEAPGRHKGYEYARTSNPTRDALQANLAALENCRYGLCFSSGLAATDAVLKLLSKGDEVLSTSDIYGGTYRLFVKVFERLGLRFRFVDLQNPARLADYLTAKTKLVWIETPSNPMMQIIDLEAVCTLAHQHGAYVAVDNTFATPYLQNPAEWGADLVVHSATKYLGGHSDVVMGAVLTNNEELYERLKFLQNACGAVPGPMDCFLVLRGIKTLHVRMQRHCENAEKIADFLVSHPKVEDVFYPGIPAHPNHAVARKQMRGFGGMLSFTLKGNRMEDALKVLSNTRLFALAESLGGVESLIGHPATMTHASIPKEERESRGLRDTLIRLSVGIEDADDLMSDLEQAIG
ncbi:MAG: cystathionine gamma-synthase [Chitinophagales bacterium]|nr:cystathionine gamma-synthase [Chitinophagales bacterium]MDW8428429.1 cystathionine gamma-synthase [Chitinophagales bacterium]